MPHGTRFLRGSSTDGDHPTRPVAWANAAAIAWVLDEAPDLPPQLVGTLIAVARYAGPDGRNAYPRVEKIAAATRKSERQVKRDLAELRKLGLLIVGDQMAAARIPSQYRPTVYDIPIWRKRGDAHVTPIESRGDTHDTPRGDMQGQEGCHPWSAGVTPTSPKEDRRTREKNQGTSKLQQRPEIQIITGATDATPDEAAAVAKLVRDEKQPDNLGGMLRKMARDGDLTDWLTEVRRKDANQQRREFMERIATEPECEHRFAGGHIVFDMTGWCSCPHERRRIGYVEPTKRDEPTPYRRGRHQPFLNPPDEAYDPTKNPL